MTDKSLLPWQQLKQLLENTETSSDKSPLSEEDVSFLAVVASEVTTGVSLPQRYPQIYDKLLTNRAWRTCFISLLYNLQAPPSNAVEESALDWEAIQHKSKVQPRISRPSWDAWEATWQRSIPQLHYVFFPTPTAVMRSLPQIPEHFDLLRTQFVTGTEKYDVVLTAYWPKEEIEQLFVTLTVHYHEPQKQPLQANLQWGEYGDNALVNDGEPYTFKPVPVDTFLLTENDADKIVAPLTFQLGHQPEG